MRPEDALAGISTRIIDVDPRHIKLLEKNARYMRQEVYQRLVSNLRRDGALTSVPFCCRDGDEWLVLSGNHRIMAAVDAEIEKVSVMVTDDDLTADQRVAIQLSHNELAGEDDPAILAELYEQIDDVDWREYAGLDDKTLELLDTVHMEPLSEANLHYQAVTVLFLPAELERAKAALADALAEAKAASEAWAAPFEAFDRLLDALDIAGKAYGVKNTAVAFGLILEVFEAHVADLAAGWWDGEGAREQRKRDWVPTATVIGQDLPAEAAGVVRQAIDRMIARGDATQPFQVLEFLAADYLAGT